MIPTKTFTSPKEALVEDGTIPTKLGKGRMSLAQKARIGELLGLGWKIAGYSISTPAPDKTTVKRTAIAPGVKEVVEMAPYRYEIEAFKAVAPDGTVFTMKEVCQPCGYSLCGHICDDPIVLGHRVRIEPR